MKQLCGLLVFAAALVAPALLKAAPSPFAGRWDITITTPSDSYPGWMELVDRDGKPEVRIQPRTGSVHPAADVKLNGAHLALTVSAADAKGPALTWELDVKGDKLTGVQKRGSAVSQLAGVRAPALKREPPKAWANAESLFDGKDLNGWEPTPPSDNHWVAQDGTLLNTKKGANIKTTRKFDDFKLHIEYNCPEDGNSGVYLRGRYEIQVEYEPVTANDEIHRMGSIYGFIAPTGNLARKPGAWESYDVTLVGRMVTVIRDSVTIIDHQEIPGTTGGALDSNEGEPGPIYIQGDHTGGMKYRNIMISVPRP
ncbi:MAG: DUF1080 domain-containing protein [Bryobacteraceae bacterium]|jgi:hypothetical protein